LNFSPPEILFRRYALRPTFRMPFPLFLHGRGDRGLGSPPCCTFRAGVFFGVPGSILGFSLHSIPWVTRKVPPLWNFFPLLSTRTCPHGSAWEKESPDPSLTPPLRHKNFFLLCFFFFFFVFSFFFFLLRKRGFFLSPVSPAKGTSELFFFPFFPRAPRRLFFFLIPGPSLLVLFFRRAIPHASFF